MATNLREGQLSELRQNPHHNGVFLLPPGLLGLNYLNLPASLARPLTDEEFQRLRYEESSQAAIDALCNGLVTAFRERAQRLFLDAPSFGLHVDCLGQAHDGIHFAYRGQDEQLMLSNFIGHPPFVCHNRPVEYITTQTQMRDWRKKTGDRSLCVALTNTGAHIISAETVGLIPQRVRLDSHQFHSREGVRAALQQNTTVGENLEHFGIHLGTL